MRPHYHWALHFKKKKTTNSTGEKEKKNGFFSGAKNIIRKYFSAMYHFRFPSGLKGAFVSATESPHLSKPKSFYQAGSCSAARKPEPPQQACDMLI